MRSDIPEKYQVRIVIWNIEGLPEDQSFNVQVKCTMNDDTGPIDKLTDTHWNAKEGVAEFNWRIIYKVTSRFIMSGDLAHSISSFVHQPFE